MPQRRILAIATLALWAGLPAHAQSTAGRMPADAKAADTVARASENWGKRK